MNLNANIVIITDEKCTQLFYFPNILLYYKVARLHVLDATNN